MRVCTAPQPAWRPSRSRSTRSPTTSPTCRPPATRRRASTSTTCSTRARGPRRPARPSPPAPAPRPRSSGAARSRVDLQPTGRTLDVAIVGQGYLEVRRPDGTIGLTRNGVLQVDAQGRLTTDTGMLLQPPMQDPERHLDRLDEDRRRTGSCARERGSSAGSRSSPSRRPIGCSPTATACSARRRRAARSAARLARRCSRGRLRARTSTSRRTMTQMIDAQRGYSMASKAIQMQDQMLQIANQMKR